MSKNQVSTADIPEVEAFVDAEDMLREFEQTHANIIATRSTLVENRNQKREAADKAVRAKEVSCGPWDIYQTQTKFNAEALYNAMGKDGFMKVGGRLQTKTAYDVDKAKVAAAIARGEIPTDVAEVVVTVSPRYHSPKEIT